MSGQEDENAGLIESGEGSADAKPYKVGYKKPPIVWQFKKGGPSPNPKGRPRKAEKRGAIAVLDDPVLVREAGELRRREPKDLSLRKQVRAALDQDNTRALFHLIQQFARIGVYSEVAERDLGGVLNLPNTMPFPMALWLAQRFGVPPWTAAELREGRLAYRATRSEQQAEIDAAIGYPDLQDGERA